MCLTIFQVNTKRNFTFKEELLHQISLWKAEGTDMFLAPAFSFAKSYTGQMRSGAGLCSAVFNSKWERSKYHILENISFTYFQHKMHNKAIRPATKHSANLQTSPTAKPHRRPKCAGTSTGSSIAGGDMRETFLPGSMTQIRSPALIQHWSVLTRATIAFCWKGGPAFQPLAPS